MKIAIHASDLDHQRIDGTRVYIKSVLNEIAELDQKDEFWIYHKTDFNPALEPHGASNFCFQKKPLNWFWTQTRFAWEVFKLNPSSLWMPVHNLPILRRKKMRTVVTIHDLAFKIFPEHFPKKDLHKLNLLTDHAIGNATKIIAISESTKKDILKIYPKVSAEKIAVVHHGFDAKLFECDVSQNVAAEILQTYALESKKYLLYVGAIQPRKNLEILVAAFEQLKKEHPDLKLVLAGARAWNWKETADKIASSPHAKDIVETGKISFAQLPVLYQNASVFVFPSLYEGFGIPVLEAFASNVPVICANNSSLPEVGGDGAKYFQANDSNELAGLLEKILNSEELQREMILKGKKQLKNFSWKKCARETLKVIRGENA